MARKFGFSLACCGRNSQGCGLWDRKEEKEHRELNYRHGLPGEDVLCLAPLKGRGATTFP